MATWIVVIRAFMICVQNKVSVLAQTEGSSGTQIIAPPGMVSNAVFAEWVYAFQRWDIFSLWGLGITYGKVYSIFFPEMRFIAKSRIK